MKHSILSFILIITVFTIVAQSPVGKWERNGEFFNIDNAGNISASFDSNTSRRWSEREGFTYNFFGSNGEQLILTLLENSEYFSLSNGQLWKRVSNVSDNAGGWSSSGNSLPGGFNGKLNNPEKTNTNSNASGGNVSNATSGVKQTNEEWVKSIVVGQWKYTYNDKTWTINSDGTVVASWDKTNRYRWQYLRENRIKIWSETSSFYSEVLIMNKGERIVVQLSGEHYLKVNKTNSTVSSANMGNTPVKQTNEDWVKANILGRWKNVYNDGVWTFYSSGTVSASWDTSNQYQWKYLRTDRIKVWCQKNNFFSEVLIMNKGERIVVQLSGEHYFKIK